MFTDLMGATRTYWKKLDAVEAAYQQGELSTQEVNVEVQQLMTELGAARRQALKELWASGQQTIAQQREAIAGTVAIGLLAYLWLTTIA